MKYKKVLEVKEDNERIYFAFFLDNNSQNIIGIPKLNSVNNTIYAGINYHELIAVDSQKAKFLLNEMMKKALSSHPAVQLCNQEAIKLIG